MTWTKLDDNFADRPVINRLGRSARLLHIETLIYCNRQLTDGRVPVNMLRRISDTESLDVDVEQLLDAGLWTVSGTEYQIEWIDQPAAKDVLTKRSVRAQTQQAYRERKALHTAGDHSQCHPTYCAKSTKGITDNAAGHVSGHKPPPRPGLSSPVPTPREGQGLGASAGSAGAPPTGPAGEVGSDDCDHKKRGLTWNGERLRCDSCHNAAHRGQTTENILEYIAWSPPVAESVWDAVLKRHPDEIHAATLLAVRVYERRVPPEPLDRDVETAFFRLLVIDILGHQHPDLGERIFYEMQRAS